MFCWEIAHCKRGESSSLSKAEKGKCCFCFVPPSKTTPPTRYFKHFMKLLLSFSLLMFLCLYDLSHDCKSFCVCPQVLCLYCVSLCLFVWDCCGYIVFVCDSGALLILCVCVRWQPLDRTLGNAYTHNDQSSLTMIALPPDFFITIMKGNQFSNTYALSPNPLVRLKKYSKTQAITHDLPASTTSAKISPR